ncbi:hypothetical protein JAO73_22295 [Hymenobacter sp. BT523]|nr:hypothetical protein [Hymenobacter sp. BT523]
MGAAGTGDEPGGPAAAASSAAWCNARLR